VNSGIMASMAKISLYGKFFGSDLAGMRMGRYSIKGTLLRGITMALAKSIILMGRLSAKEGIEMEVSIFFNGNQACMGRMSGFMIFMESSRILEKCLRGKR
jgi:hypothetical protein